VALARAVAVRHGEIRRFALALRATVRALKANRVSLDAIVSELAPGLTSRPGIGPAPGAHAIVSYFHTVLPWLTA
jgi:transposase